MGEFPGSVDCFVDESRTWIDQNDHRAIVLHCTASANPDQTDIQLGNYFETNAARVSTHYGIDRTGAIAQYVLEKDGAGGNGILDSGHDPFWDQYADNPNWHSLSVECENDVNNSLPLTSPQMQTLFKLVAYWVAKYNIPLSNIKGHFTLEPVNRHDCPGLQFPWQELFSYLGASQGPTTLENSGMYTTQSADFHTYFTEIDADHWKCNKNGNVVQLGIKTFYQGLTLDGETLPIVGLPTSNEIYTTIKGKKVVVQFYERGILAFEQNNPHALDSQPGTQDCYLAKYDDPVVAKLDPNRKS